MAIVEDERAEAAMVIFGECLDSNVDRAILRQLSLLMGYVFRESLARVLHDDRRASNLRGQPSEPLVKMLAAATQAGVTSRYMSQDLKSL